jgi:RNA polymerase sigma-70 factor, ECF subfamily
MQLYVDRFNRRDWDGVRELTSADARLNVAERFAGKFAHAPYFFNYERWVGRGNWRWVNWTVSGGDRSARRRDVQRRV